MRIIPGSIIYQQLYAVKIPRKIPRTVRVRDRLVKAKEQLCSNQTSVFCHKTKKWISAKYKLVT